MATEDKLQMKDQGSVSGDGVAKLDVPSANNSSSKTDLVVSDKHNDYEIDQTQIKEHDTKYCCCCLRPGFTQCLASLRWFVVFVCFLVTNTALMIGIFQGNLTTTETRYQLSASQLGLSSSMFTVGSVVATIFVTHFGGRPKSHRPRWIAIGAITMATGCFIICLPQFMFGPYEYNSVSTNTSSSSSPEGLCDLGNTETTSSSMLDCGDEKHQMVYENFVAYVMIVLGQLVIGFGYGPLMPLALAFIDDNTDSSTTGLYSGIIESMWGVGAIFGFQISASIVGLWVDFYRVDTETIDITPKDPRYVGAWWLGTLIAAALFALFSTPFWGFPKNLTQNDCPEHNGNISKNEEKREIVRRNKPTATFKELVHSLWDLCSNKVYISVCGTMMMQGAIIYSFSAFLPKYLESQFGLPTQQANIAVGFMLVPAYGFGALLGGILVKRLGLKAMGSTKMSMVCSLSCCLMASTFIFLGCPNQPIAGITSDYQNHSSLAVASLNAPCNTDCGCSSSSGYSPICGADGVTYFSPCYAGCLDLEENKTYSDCECVFSPLEPDLKMEATSGPCDYTDCSSLIAFLGFMFIGIFLLACILPPRIVIIVSCVEFSDKSMAIGVSRIIMLLLGSIPGPILYGTLIDTACIYWQSVCDTRGSCWVYDIDQFRHIFGVTTTLIFALQFVLFVLIYVFLRISGEPSVAKDNGVNDKAVSSQ